MDVVAATEDAPGPVGPFGLGWYSAIRLGRHFDHCGDPWQVLVPCQPH